MKRNKILVFTLVCAMMMTLLAGCGGSAKPSGKGISNKNKTSKVIKVGMEVAYPPFEYYEDDGKTIAGIDYELINAICNELGYKAEIVPVAWEAIFAGLDKGDYDVIMSAITVTPERAEKYSFTTPYMENYQCIISLKAGQVKPKSVEELNGLKVGYQEGATSDTFLTDYIEAGKVTCTTNEYSKIVDTFSDLRAGRLDAVLCDSTVAEQYLFGDVYQMTWKQEGDPEQFAACFPKDSEYVAEFNKALETLKNNGRLQDIIDSYI